MEIPYELHIAGSGSLEKEITDKLKGAIDEGKVIFHGFLAAVELFKLMAKCNIYVSFSEFEGISTSLIQAMCFELIPVITRTQSGSDFLTQKNDALFFAAGDVTGAAENIRLFISKKERHPQMVENVKATVQKQFNINASIENLRSIMEQLDRPYDRY